MLRLKYIGCLSEWVGKTAIGYYQDGDLLVQYDDFHHPLSHGWWAADPRDYVSRDPEPVINKKRIKQRIRVLKYYLSSQGKEYRKKYSRGIRLDGANHIFNHVKFDEVVRCGPINLWSVTTIDGRRYWYSSKIFWRRS